MKCRVCGIDHRGVAKHGGFCLDHQENRAEEAEAERNTAWQELRDIRSAISADPDESTLDEVVALRCQLEQAQSDLATYHKILDVVFEANGVHQP